MKTKPFSFKATANEPESFGEIRQQSIHKMVAIDLTARHFDGKGFTDIEVAFTASSPQEMDHVIRWLTMVRHSLINPNTTQINSTTCQKNS